MTQEVKLGIRFNPRVGVEFFGIREVNAMISQGGRIVSIQQGDAVFTKVGENEVTTRMVLCGCDMKAVVEFPASPGTPVA